MGQDSAQGSVIGGLVPDAIRRRFVAKFALSVVVVMVLTAALGAVMYGQATATLTDRTDAQIESTAQLQADGLDRWIEGFEHQTRLLSQAPAFQTGNESTIDFYLLDKRRTLREDIHAVHFVSTRTWEVLVSTHDAAEGRNATATMPWASADRDRISMATNVPSNVEVAEMPYESPGGGERVLAFVSAPPQGTEYLVVVEANLSTCQRSFDQPSADAYTTVHTADGTSVCGGAPSGDPTVPSEALAANGSGTVQADGSVVGHATVDRTGWTVLTHVPTGAAYGLRDQIGTSIVALVALPLVLLGAVALVLGRRVGAELETLTDHAAAMREGDLDVDIETSRPDEFGALARGFAEMRDALKQQIEEAEQARREAEVARAEAVETNEYLQAKAEEYSETLQACARGDLTQRMDHDGEHEAMDRIAADFNEMIRELELTTGQLQTFAAEVSDGGEDVHESAEAVKAASEQVAESVQKISDDAYDGRERLANVAEELEAVVDSLEDTPAGDAGALDEPLARLQEIADRVEAAAAASETVMAESETVAGAAEEQAAELTEVSDRALELRRTARYLGDGIGHFETEGEHEFVFQTGRGDADATPESGD